ncbi:MAG: hypothetical protein VYC56_10110 [Actinomycetota bacterium]|nr:hypothetical protein [Actinomycetota bacterium]
MAVERGRDWGRRSVVPDDAPVVGSDAALADLLASGSFDRGDDAPPVVLVGGDLCRTLGGRGGARPGSEATVVEVDVGRVLVDGRIYSFVAHVVAGTLRRPGRWWVAANAAHRGRWNAAPRSHPGDGLLDLLESDLRPGEVFGAWRRLGAGIHVPHPRISAERARTAAWSFPVRTPVRIDGRPPVPAREVVARLDPDDTVWVAV